MGKRPEMQDKLALERDLFWLAAGFLTVLPVPAGLPESDDLTVRSAKYYPLVGAIVGVLCALVWLVASVALPPLVAALLAVTTAVLVTGGMHERGLFVTAEALSLEGPHRAVLRMVRARQGGLFGGMAVGLCLALKVALLASFSPAAGAALLPVAQGLSRMAVVHTEFTTRDVREKGRRRVAVPVTPDGYRIALSISVVLAAVLLAVLGLGVTIAVYVGSILLGQAFRRGFMARLGGYTGSCLGGVQQMAELGSLLGAAVIMA